jgi:nitrate/nitrite-specific signal transduction histidine kinase
LSHNNRAKTLRKLRIEEETNKELESLLDVGTALSAEHESTKVLQMILDKATENTNADGGSIYLIEKVKQDSFGGTRPAYKPVLRFCYALNHSFQIPVKNEILEIDQAKGKVKVMVTIFGRETPVELDFLQVRKA